MKKDKELEGIIKEFLNWQYENDTYPGNREEILSVLDTYMWYKNFQQNNPFKIGDKIKFEYSEYIIREMKGNYIYLEDVRDLEPPYKYKWVHIIRLYNKEKTKK